MLAAKNSEAEMLASDLLIGVTSFFRDRLAWNALDTEVVKQLATRKDRLSNSHMDARMRYRGRGLFNSHDAPG